MAPFKVGPDFIDPGHHTRITGTISRNLDGWIMPKEGNLACFYTQMEKGADIAVVEGVMGLFDGYDGKTEAGSTAQMAKWLNLPVLLMVDAKSMARSAAALVKGFEQFDPDLTFCGVVFNNIGSHRHLTYLQDALKGHVKMPCLGGLRHNSDVAIPERHLGLVTEDEFGLSDENINQLADMIEERIDIEGLLKRLPELHLHKGLKPDVPQIKEPTVRIAVARDKAFCFYYRDNLDLLEENGAKLVFFSPLNDTVLPDNVSGIYLGGGYPEMFAQELSQNNRMKQAVLDMSMADMPIYGECGGFMYLCRDIRNFKGKQFGMTGCFPFSSRMTSKLRSLGYREVTLEKDTLLGKCGQIIRGHEFHYSEIEMKPNGTETVYNVSKGRGLDCFSEGYLKRQTLGSYIHLHFGSHPTAPEKFVEACRAFKK